MNTIAMDPLVASTNMYSNPTIQPSYLDSQLIQQLLFPNSQPSTQTNAQALSGYNVAKKRPVEQELGQRKNLSHVATPAPIAAVKSLQASSSTPGTPVNTQGAAPAAGADTPLKKKPGRKPATTEPANKRTAQNRAAQRAFRERKERYVKELETRVQQLEDAQRHAEAGSLIEENTKLRRKLEALESENTILREMSFSFEFPTGQAVPGAQELPNDISTQSNYSSAQSDYSPDLMTGQQLGVGQSPLFSVAQSSPYSTSTNDVPSLDGGDTYSSLFDEQHSTASEHDITSPPNPDQGFKFFGAQPGPAYDVLSTLADPTQPFINTSTPTLDFSSSAFHSYRDAGPFSATFNNPTMPSINDDEFNALFAPINTTDDSVLTGLGMGVPEPPKTVGTGSEECKKIYNDVKAMIDDPGAIDQLCDIFKAKAQCSEFSKLQSQILDACKEGNKDEILDLINICKEKKRMHMLRLKAGVTTLAPEYTSSI
ncbi:hypothetical protein HK097_009596 [Rhizophlyctis rosea]|uniref:BZIP domain-containing protein n=1 Tax=Rhizophlyctis rosea TaxID=64517 RepID=A0AAD5X916_9FUNG|nr:hypothetical protein HK097_009596 [Rhizophlyctis rosea]